MNIGADFFGQPSGSILLILLIMLILIAGFVAGVRHFAFGSPRSAEKCPNCGSSEVGVVSKEPQGIRDVSGGFSSRHDVRGTIVKVRYLIKKRCNNCRHGWEKTVEES